MGRIPSDEIYRSPRKNRVVILEDVDFIWDDPELREMSKMWESEVSVKDIATHFKRDADEVLLALIHLARHYRIKSRISGLRGNNDEPNRNTKRFND